MVRDDGHLCERLGPKGQKPCAGVIATAEG